MQVKIRGGDISRSALIIVDMQNDFLHQDGNFLNIAREHPELGIDVPFLQSTISPIARLANAFRAAGRHGDSVLGEVSMDTCMLCWARGSHS
jgi:hypothetical protein